jgi:hypothetical protein
MGNNPLPENYAETHRQLMYKTQTEQGETTNICIT